MSIEEFKDSVRKNAEWVKPDTQVMGGQHCGVFYPPVVLKSEDLDLEISLGYHRSRMKNKEIVESIFELLIEKLIG